MSKDEAIKRAMELRTRLYKVSRDLYKLGNDVGFNICGCINYPMGSSNELTFDAFYALLSLADSIPKFITSTRR